MADSKDAVQQKSGLLLVHRHFTAEGNKTLLKDEKGETLEVREFLTAPAEVGFAMGSTLNMGRYEMARVDVSVKLPCYSEERDAAFETAKKFVEERYKAEVAEAREFMKASTQS